MADGVRERHGVVSSQSYYDKSHVTAVEREGCIEIVATGANGGNPTITAQAARTFARQLNRLARRVDQQRKEK